MEKMDVECPSNYQIPNTQRKPSCSSFCCCISLTIVICLAFSTAALILSILTFYDTRYALDRSGGLMSTGIPHWEDKQDWPGEDEVLLEIEAIFETEGKMRFPEGHKSHSKADSTSVGRVERSADHDAGLDDLCNSTTNSGNHSNLKPLAHIVPLFREGPAAAKIDTETRTRYNTFVPITKNWTCSKPVDVTKPVPHGMILGGMVFNRTSGFLQLPKDGVYYVYSHVLFQLSNTSETLRTSVRMVACIPELECEFAQPGNAKDFSVSNSVVTQYKDKKIGDDGIYQGGLYHLSAGTQISLLVINPKGRVRRGERQQEDKLFISRAKESSYFGAFLVQELPLDAN